MLILTRVPGETVMVGENVEVTVMAVDGLQVRIGITAPKDVAVHREEIYERIQQQGTTPARHPQAANRTIVTKRRKRLPGG